MIAPTTTNESWKPVKKFIRIPAKKKKGRRRETIKHEDFSLEEQTAEGVEAITAARTLETCSPVTAA